MMTKEKRNHLRFRQIHLDFHTSEDIPGIGSEFDEDEFVGTLEKAHVNSITAFATCHHGWAYYPTKIPGLAHPQLETDLLGRMHHACAAAGINVVAYITIMWNAKEAREHPDWVVRTLDGKGDMLQGNHPNTPKPMGGGWQRICYNSPYLDEIVLPVTKEVMELYNPPGIFYDITGEFECICDNCLAGMREEGLDPDSADDRRAWAQLSYKRYLKKTTELVWSMNPKTAVYHNGSDKKGRHDLYEYFTHHEIESLPSGFWGYSHFPTNARYFTMVPGYDILGMTGKFHTMWGEFGGFKNPVALTYECAQMISLGAKCSVGDQLHPTGKIDSETYRIIGQAYDYVEQREAWCEDVTSVCDVAVVAATAITRNMADESSEMGAARMLMEMHVPFDIVDTTMDLGKYRMLVLPDVVPVDPGFKQKLDAFVAAGGAVIASYRGGLDEAGAFALDFGLTCNGPSPWDTEYLVVGDQVARDQVRTPYICYEGAMMTDVVDAEVLADVHKPYFNRTWGRFCGHRNTPPEGDAGYPGVTRKGNAVYFAHPVFRMYHNKGMQLYRDLFRNCFELLYTDPLFTADYPSCGRISIMRQENRTIIHLLYAMPIKRGVELIEDVVPVFNIPVTLKTAQPRRVYLAPQNEDIPFEWADGRLSFTLAKLDMHEMIVIDHQ